MERLSHSAAARLRVRTAFTLIELLISIAIIAILAGLILMAGSAAKIAARNTQVAVDIQDLTKGIALFKNRFGIEPPSKIVLQENPAGTAWDSRSRGIIAQMWPQFDFTIAQDINNNGVTGETITLTGVECLVFFLGGIPDVPIASGNAGFPGRGPLGFSQNPANPFALGGTNRERFAEFNIARYVDLDNDTMMELCDPLPGQQKPYLYMSSYGGQGYDISELVGSPANISNAPGGTFIDVYRQGAQGFWAPALSTQPESGQNLTNNSSTPSQPWNPNSFQIISPGGDGLYGIGGQYDPNHANALLTIFAGAATPPPNSVDRTGERDNITNFASGVLAP